jgi:hypothetical protein
MVPEFPDISLPGSRPKEDLIASTGTPPLWQDSWIRYIPFLGKTIVCGMNASRYKTTLEQNADFIARDLGEGGREWVGMTVGVISRSMLK